MMAALAHRNRRVGMMAALIGAAMLALGFASVPLYRLFCQVTGFDGTPQKKVGGQAPGEIIGKMINVRFDANVTPGMAWKFEPEQRVEHVAIGAREMAFFNATNESDRTIKGRATFNVTPTQAGQYFTKVQCFCFTEQVLKPGETIRMPVVYYVDPAMLRDTDANDISEITLSYTFYPDDSPVDSPATGG